MAPEVQRMESRSMRYVLAFSQCSTERRRAPFDRPLTKAELFGRKQRPIRARLLPAG